MANEGTEGPDTSVSPWKSTTSAGNVSIKIGFMHGLMSAVIQAFEARYGEEQCCKGDFPEQEETLFVSANSLFTTLSVCQRWLEYNYLPNQDAAVDPMVAWVLGYSYSVFTEFRELPWVTTQIEKGELRVGIQKYEEMDPTVAPN